MEMENLHNQILDLRRQINLVRMTIPPLRNLAEKCGIYIGAAVSRGLLNIS